MRRMISFLLTLGVLLMFAGCSKPQKSPIYTDSEPSTLSTTGESMLPTISDSGASLQVPLICVSAPVVHESEFSDNGVEIYKYVYQNMSLVLPEPEIADKIILDFLNRVDSLSSDAESIRLAAKEDYNTGNWTPYLCQITYDTMRIDSGVLSLFGSHVRYSGGSHPENTDVSVSYDLTTGEVITLDKIIVDNITEKLTTLIIESLNDQKQDNHLFNDFEDTVKDRFTNGLSHEYNWYFSGTGLCFYFSAYDIAPYSSGVIVAEIPYEKLAGLMDDAYFPAEQEAVNGILAAELFNEDQLNKYDSFSEVIVNKDAVKALLYTDSSVYDVRIETGSWSADGNAFIPEQTVYAAYALTAGNAIIVESEIPDTLPRLRITYQTGGQVVSCYLTDSSEDGSIMLTHG